ncbi:biliverdin-producing heme oxygenase [Haloferula rosea]|uniref:Biliverdin-producing heme oxygenase n=1 Tax=Haloferula rosea TaxID=490093 RepID=A0A934R9G4_9BACT|nr:biliverdin-producing heme oxygenase [Haloferula rosea]MBK1825658.1 biliverdin-producing heme oxygenase [Haloferula rosea]
MFGSIEVPLGRLLRAATADAHRRLDEQLSVEAITRSVSCCHDYLARHADALREVDGQLDWASIGALELPDLSARRARYALLLDSEMNAPEPSACARPSLSTAGMVGALYVLEGSVHGGREILKALNARFPNLGPESTSYLAGFGEETAVMWRSFLNWLDTLDFDAAGKEEASDAARMVFGVFTRHLGLTTEATA